MGLPLDQDWDVEFWQLDEVDEAAPLPFCPERVRLRLCEPHRVEPVWRVPRHGGSGLPDLLVPALAEDQATSADSGSSHVGGSSDEDARGPSARAKAHRRRVLRGRVHALWNGFCSGDDEDEPQPGGAGVGGGGGCPVPGDGRPPAAPPGSDGPLPCGGDAFGGKDDDPSPDGGAGADGPGGGGGDPPAPGGEPRGGGDTPGGEDDPVPDGGVGGPEPPAGPGIAAVLAPGPAVGGGGGGRAGGGGHAPPPAQEPLNGGHSRSALCTAKGSQSDGEPCVADMQTWPTFRELAARSSYCMASGGAR